MQQKIEDKQSYKRYLKIGEQWWTIYLCEKQWVNPNQIWMIVVDLQTKVVIPLDNVNPQLKSISP